jgi:hypothetical protein
VGRSFGNRFLIAGRELRVPSSKLLELVVESPRSEARERATAPRGASASSVNRPAPDRWWRQANPRTGELDCRVLSWASRAMRSRGRRCS